MYFDGDIKRRILFNYFEFLRCRKKVELLELRPIFLCVFGYVCNEASISGFLHLEYH